MKIGFAGDDYQSELISRTEAIVVGCIRGNENPGRETIIKGSTRGDEETVGKIRKSIPGTTWAATCPTVGACD